ncbi:MAG: hypothetical protein EP330_30445 [Deltaproteobacteria bacterium]|nr:MAG: hypothetical protein EP330_30445 [Deltaproteobacteria bacterium]
MRTLLPLLALAACTPPGDGPLPIYEPESEALFDAPWPTDARRSEDGTLDVSGFPNPEELSLLERYLEAATELRGYGTNSPLYLRFEDEIDLTRLPTPAQSLEEGAGLFLVDADPTSPFFGDRVPVRWSFEDNDRTYQPGNLLAVAPVWGFPLRPNTRYGLVVTTAVTAAHPDMADDLDLPRFEGLDEVLRHEGIKRKEVAVATVFTTGDPTAEMRRMARFIHENIEPAQFNRYVNSRGENLFQRRYDGAYPGPLFQHGDRPYAFEGGEFRFNDDGSPQIAAWDDMRFRICTPADLSTMPAEGWPVVIYQHGTGGNYTTPCNSSDAMEVASQLGTAGIVTFSIEHPLHGVRATSGTDEELHSFNVLNPDSARTNFRQGALDAIYLAHAFASQPGLEFETEEGDVIRLDTTRVGFMGHSQGGLTGALATPFFGDTVDASMLSGVGGGLAITVVVRKDPQDFAELLGNALQFEDGEEVTDLHPVVGVLQWLVESTDPLNYGPLWYAEDGYFGDQAPKPVLVTSGLEDEQTSYLTAEALASAARMPILAPRLTSPDSFALRSLPEVVGPLADNVETYEGGAVTAAFTQWNDDHYVVFDDPRAARMYRHFLETSLIDGAPTIDVNPP